LLTSVRVLEVVRVRRAPFAPVGCGPWPGARTKGPCEIGLPVLGQIAQAVAEGLAFSAAVVDVHEVSDAPSCLDDEVDPSRRGFTAYTMAFGGLLLT
jgi:hypothetical protein